MRKSMSLTMDKVFADRNNNDRFIDKGNHAFTLTIKGYTEEKSEKIIDTFEARMSIIIDDCNDFSMARCPSIDVDEDNNCEYSDTLVIIDEEIDTLKKEWKKFKKSENIKKILKSEVKEEVKTINKDKEIEEMSEEEIKEMTCCDCGTTEDVTEGICSECLNKCIDEERKEERNLIEDIPAHIRARRGWWYVGKYRGPSLGTIPQGHIYIFDSQDYKFPISVYNRKLTIEEIEEYELLYAGYFDPYNN